MNLRNSTFFLSLSNLMSVLATLILGVFLAHYIDKVTYGKFQQLYVIIPFVTALTSGIPLGLSYFYGRYEKFRDRIFLFRRLFLTMICVSFCLTIVFFLLRGFFSDIFSNSLFEEEIASFCGLVFFRVTNTYFVNLNTVRSKLIQHLMVVSFGLLLLLVLMLAVHFFLLDIHSILVILLSIEIIKFILFAGMNYDRMFLPYFKTTSIIRKSESIYILPLTFVALLNIGNLYVDKYMIAGMLDATAFADYQVGAFTLPFIGIITGSVVTALLPVFSKYYHQNDYSSITRTWKDATTKTTIFLLPIFIYSIAFGQEIITFFYGEEYQLAGQIFSLYTYRFLMAVVLFSLTMSAIGLQNWIVINSLINLLMNAVMNYFFIIEFGVMGAVYASIITTYLGIIFPIYLIKKKINAGFFSYFPWKIYLGVALVSVITLIPFTVTIKMLLLPNFWAVIFSPVFYVVVIGFSFLVILGRPVSELTKLMNRK